MNIIAPAEQTLSVDCRRAGYFIPAQIRVRNEGPLVVMLFGTTRLELRTFKTWELAWQLNRAADECIREANDGVLWAGDLARDFVVLKINGQEVHLRAADARKLAYSLWRRSDAVDDWQLDHKVRFLK